MNSNEVRKRLFKDISFLPLPPLSDKVYQAVSEQKKRYTEMVSHRFGYFCTGGHYAFPTSCQR